MKALGENYNSPENTLAFFSHTLAIFLETLAKFFQTHWVATKIGQMNKPNEQTHKSKKITLAK
jgi:hypothetical protein